MQPQGMRPQPGSAGAGRLEAWSLDCRKEPLSATLGPPEYYPLYQGCKEDSLGKDALVNGWRYTTEALGISEAREGALTLCSAAGLWEGAAVKGYRKALWRNLRLLHRSQRSARLAGQAWHVPLAGEGVAKPGAGVPEQRLCTNEARERWMQDLAGSRPLHQLAESVPTWHAPSALFKSLYRHNVPMARAVWLVRVVYLNSVKPTGPSGGAPSQLPHLQPPPRTTRSSIFTQHLVEFLDDALWEVSGRGGASRGRGSQAPLAGSSAGDGPSAEETPISETAVAKWLYAVQLAGWVHREGLVEVEQLLTWLQRGPLSPGSSPSDPGIVEAAALLELLAQDVSSCQELARRAMDMVCQLLEPGCLPHGDPASPSANVRRSLVGVVRKLLASAPDLLCAVSFDIPEEDFVDNSTVALPGPPGGPAGYLPARLRQVPGGSGGGGLTRLLPPGGCRNGSTIAAAAAYVTARRNSLSWAVRPPVLEWDEAGAVAGLSAGMASGSVEAAMKVLPLGSSSPPEPAAVAEVVGVVASWVCQGRLAPLASPLLAAPSDGPLPGTWGSVDGSSSCWLLASRQAARRAFGCHLLRRLIGAAPDSIPKVTPLPAAKKEGMETTQEPGVRGRAFSPPLQAALTKWIGRGGASGSSAALGGSPIGSGGPEAESVAALLIGLAEQRLFCPVVYLDRLLADGTFEPLREPSETAGEVEAVVAARSHMAVLQHLHHRMNALQQGSPWEAPGGVAAPSSARDVAERGRGAPRSYVKNRQWVLVEAHRGLGEEGEGEGGLQRKRAKLSNGSAAPPAEGGAVQQQSPKSRVSPTAMQYAAAAVLGLGLRSPPKKKAAAWAEGGPVSESQLLAALASAMPWERRCVGAWLEAVVPLCCCSHEGSQVLGGQGPGGPEVIPPREAPDGQWLLQAVMLLDASDAHSAASEWLLTLLEARCQLIAGQCSCSPSPGGLAAGTNIPTGAVLSALRSRHELLAADLLLPRAFQACVGWLLDESAGPAQARERGAQLIQYAGELLARSHGSRKDPLEAWLEAKTAALSQQHWAMAALQRAKVNEESHSLAPSVRDKIEALRRLPDSVVLQVEQVYGPLASSPDSGVACDPQAMAAALMRWAGGAASASSSDCSPTLLAVAAVAKSFTAAADSPAVAFGGASAGPATPPPGARHLAVLDALLLSEAEGGYSNLPSYIMAACCWTSFPAAAGSDGGALPKAVQLLTAAIAHGLVLLSDALSALLAPGPSKEAVWVKALLGSAAASSSGGGGAVSTAEARCLAGLQLNLPLEVLLPAAAAALEPPIASGPSHPQHPLAEELLRHEPLRLALLKEPWKLYLALTDRKGLPPLELSGRRCHTLPARLLVISLATGRLASMAAAPPFSSPEERAVAVTRLLEGLTPFEFELHCLNLRLLLDEQVLLEKLKTQSAGEALKAASRAYAEAASGRPSEADKQLANGVLAAIAVRPGLAALQGELCLRLGTGIADHLLQQLDQIFQDPASTRNPSQSQLLGRAPLLQVLRKRVDIEAARGSSAEATEAAIASVGPFALESAMATLALSVLKKSIGAKQKDFADQLVRQLSRLAEVLSSSEGSSGPVAAAVSGPAASGAHKLKRANSAGSGWGRTLSLRASEADATPGPAAAVQVAVWMRLQVLIPLLPVVYSDQEPDPKKNLRSMLSSSLVQLLRSAPIRSPPSSAAASAAAATAWEPLSSRLLAVLHGLLGGQWATWLSRHSKEKLREALPLANTSQLQQAISGARLQHRVSQRLSAAMPVPLPPLLTVPPAGIARLASEAPLQLTARRDSAPSFSRADSGGPFSSSQEGGGGCSSGSARPPLVPPPPPTSAPGSGTTMEPWQLLEVLCPPEGAAGARACHWLAGAVRVPRRSMTYAIDIDAGD